MRLTCLFPRLTVQDMRRTGRTRTAVLALLAVLSGLSGPVWAVCVACQPATAAPMTGCHGARPAIHPACCGGSAVAPAKGCCGHLAAAEPLATAPPSAVRLAPAGIALAASTASAAETVRQTAVPVRLSPPPEDPPPLYADVGLYTLHAVFLI